MFVDNSPFLPGWQNRLLHVSQLIFLGIHLLPSHRSTTPDSCRSPHQELVTRGNLPQTDGDYTIFKNLRKFFLFFFFFFVLVMLCGKILLLKY